MEKKQGHDATMHGQGKPNVLSYASPASQPRADATWIVGSNVVVLFGILFVVGACAAGVEVALLIAVFGAVLYIGLRMEADGHRPVWLAPVVAVLAGTAMVAIGVQVLIVASDPGHPQSRWRLPLFKPTVVAVMALAGAVEGHRRSKRR